MPKMTDGDMIGNQTLLQETGMETQSDDGYGKYPAGIVDTLKKIERKNRVPMTGVDIRFHSAFPAQMDAKATSFGGSQVDIGPGQEACINHELGHIVQQRMGMVKATGKIGGRWVNTNQSLEEDATRRGTV